MDHATLLLLLILLFLVHKQDHLQVDYIHLKYQLTCRMIHTIHKHNHQFHQLGQLETEDQYILCLPCLLHYKNQEKFRGSVREVDY